MTFKIKDGVRIGTVDVFNNSGALLVSAPIANDSVTLGTHTVGNYASEVTAGTGITVTGTAGEGTSFAVAHADTSSQASVDNSGNTFIQDITLDGFGHITALTSATVSIGAGALTLAVSSGNTNTAVTIGTGTGFTANSSAAATYDIDVGPALTNLASTMTGAGSGFLKKNGADTYTIDSNTYLTAEADTLATVTARGNTTATAVSFTNNTASTTTGTGAVVVTGGVGIGGALNVGGALTVAGNLVVNGTTTTVNSTTVTLDDPIFTLGGDTSIAETTKDRGIETKWNGTALTITNYIGANSTTVTGTVASTTGYAVGDIITISGATGTEQTKLNGTWTIASVPNATTFTFVVTSSVAAGTYTSTLGTTVKSKNAFFGLDQSTGKFTFIPQALNNNEVFSGTKGEIDANVAWSNITGAPAILTAEADTLQTVTDRGASTSNGVVFANTVSYGNAVNTIISEDRATLFNVSTISTIPINFWAIDTYRSAKYLIQITQGSTYQVSEILVLHNGTTTTMTEYAVLESNSALGAFTSAIASGNVELRVTMASNSAATIKIHRTLITV